MPIKSIPPDSRLLGTFLSCSCAVFLAFGNVFRSLVEVRPHYEALGNLPLTAGPLPFLPFFFLLKEGGDK